MRCLLVLVALVAFVSAGANAQQTPRDPSAPPADESRDADSSTAPATADGDAVPTADEVVVTGHRPEAPPAATRIESHELDAQRTATSDAARLLEDVPGVSLNAAGGISSLPSIRGLADDRLRVQVDGMDVTSACPNHMNSPLSYISPVRVRRATVFAGITPVSAGGNSIGGTIQVESAVPEFAPDEKSVLASAQGGAFFRTNGKAFGRHFGVAAAGRDLRLAYDESTARSRNVVAGDRFKASGAAAPLRGRLEADEIGSSAYDGITNRELGLALRRDDHLLQLNLGRQIAGFEGFPNQRMDMTSNANTLVNLRYAGTFSSATLEASAFAQETRHEMNMGPDRFFYGLGMPMNSKATTRGAKAAASFDWTDQHLLRVGSEFVAYHLDDWWPAVGSSGSMCCNEFRNLHAGVQNRFGLYGEWEARWNDQWLTLLGVRGDFVSSAAGRVHGYNGNMGIWTGDAAAFNARDRDHTDTHLDWMALLRWEPLDRLRLETGYARKTRSPNLYERYAWATNAMAALMNNFVGDGNGYVGKTDLTPEVAHTASASIALHDPGEKTWGVDATAYLTRVEDFIDARRCDFGQCSAANRTATRAFVFLQYVNQSALLYGADLSAHWRLGQLDPIGRFTLRGGLGYVRGKNRTTGDDLFHVMPLHGTLALVHERGPLTNRIEFRTVAAKTRVSSVRNEMPTAHYSLLDLRTSYEFEHLRVDLAVENVFDRFYELPLGGAYVGQGLSMSSLTIPWGLNVPGPGRSFHLAVSVDF